MSEKLENEVYIQRFPIIDSCSRDGKYHKSQKYNYFLYYDLSTNKYRISKQRIRNEPVYNPELSDTRYVRSFYPKFKMLTNGELNKVMYESDTFSVNLIAVDLKDSGLKAYYLNFLGVEKEFKLATYSNMYKGGIYLTRVPAGSMMLAYNCISLSSMCAYLVWVNKDLLIDIIKLCDISMR